MLTRPRLALLAAAALAAVCAWADAPRANKPFATADRIPVLTAKEAADLEGRVRKLHAKLAPTVVRLWTHGKDGKAFDANGFPQGGAGSGVIIRKDGLILTCAHHGLKPGTGVTVEMADGKRREGTYLGRFELPSRGKDGQITSHPDLGLAKITEKGDYPAAALGGAELPEPGTVYLAVGYPGTLAAGKPPLLRLGRTVPSLPDRPLITGTTGFVPGDSGGPMFDLEGRVLGVLMGSASYAPDYQPVGPLAKHQAALEAGKVVAAPVERAAIMPARPTYQGAFSPADDLRTAALEAAYCRLTILDGVTEIALGLAVGKDGWVLTKRSLIEGKDDLNVRLSYTLNANLTVTATVAATSAEHDLALLKLDPVELKKALPNGLFVPKWADARPAVGQLVTWASARSARPMQYGVVGSSTAKLDPPMGDVAQLPLSVKEGPKGEAVVETTPQPFDISPEKDPFRRLFKPGDIVTHLDGAPTPTFKALGAAQMKHTYAAKPDGTYDLGRPARGSLAGNSFTVTVRRAGKPVTVRLAKVHSGIISPITWHMAPRSLRRDGFPAVFSHDGWVAPEECGGPLLDLQGRVVGLNIARADATRTLTIPADVLRKVAEELVKQAKK